MDAKVTDHAAPRQGVTVVIPVHNRAEMIRRTVADILRQTRLPEALVLVDNASTDNTAQTLHDLAAECRAAGLPATVLTEPVPGACAARNRGLQEVDTEWVMFFDSDDFMAPGHVAAAMDEAAAHPGADIIGWDVYYTRSGQTSVHRYAARNLQYHSLMNGAMATQRYMVRTAVARAAGGWDNNVKIWNDIEFGARLLRQTSAVVYRRGTPMVTVNVHPQSITGANYSSRAEAFGASLQAMARTLGPRRRPWILLKAMILAGELNREGSELGARYRREILGTAGSAYIRALLRFAYSYHRRGLRGIARILRPLMPR